MAKRLDSHVSLLTDANSHQRHKKFIKLIIEMNLHSLDL